MALDMVEFVLAAAALGLDRLARHVVSAVVAARRVRVLLPARVGLVLVAVQLVLVAGQPLLAIVLVLG